MENRVQDKNIWIGVSGAPFDCQLDGTNAGDRGASCGAADLVVSVKEARSFA